MSDTERHRRKKEACEKRERAHRDMKLLLEARQQYAQQLRERYKNKGVQVLPYWDDHYETLTAHTQADEEISALIDTHKQRLNSDRQRVIGTYSLSLSLSLCVYFFILYITSLVLILTLPLTL